MKYTKVFLVGLFTFFCFGLSAQVFVGGNVGFNGHNNETKDGATITEKTSSYNFSLSPEVGKFFSERLAAGVELSLLLSGQKTGVNPESNGKAFGVAVSPYLRYYTIKWNKFSVYGQGNIGMSFNRTSSESGGTTTEGPKITRSYMEIYPGLSYDISEKFELETSLNFFSFGYYFSSSKGELSSTTSSGIHFGAGLDNIISTDMITIGGIFKF